MEQKDDGETIHEQILVFFKEKCLSHDQVEGEWMWRARKEDLLDMQKVMLQDIDKVEGIMQYESVMKIQNRQNNNNNNNNNNSSNNNNNNHHNNHNKDTWNLQESWILSGIEKNPKETSTLTPTDLQWHLSRSVVERWIWSFKRPSSRLTRPRPWLPKPTKTGVDWPHEGHEGCFPIAKFWKLYVQIRL